MFLISQCEELLEGLLQNGRLSMEQLVERAKSSKHAGKFIISKHSRLSCRQLLLFTPICSISNKLLFHGGIKLCIDFNY